jgi:DNA-binding transcriptional regulator WhiA
MQKIFREFVNEIKQDKFTSVLNFDDEIFCRQKVGRKKLIRIPLKNSDNLSFLAGIIIGDGHLGKKKKRIQIEMDDVQTLTKVVKIFHEIFNVRTKLRIVRKQELYYQQTWRIVFESKEISLFFNKVFEIPLGRKSHIIKVPSIIFESNANLKRSFIKGLFFADGSFKKKTIRFSSKSQQLIDDLGKLFETIGFRSVKRVYRNKTFDINYFELFLMTEEAERFKLKVPDILIKTKPESPSLAMAQDRIVRNLRI